MCPVTRPRRVLGRQLRDDAELLEQSEMILSLPDLRDLAVGDPEGLDLAFGRRYQIAAPFQWKFTRHDLHKLLVKTDAADPTSLAA
jgi:hypothetical protein